MAAERDTVIATALRSGDETAFARLVRARSAGLMRIAMALSGDRAAAETVVRATWLRVPTEVADYRPPPALWPWLCGLLLGQLGLLPGDEGPEYDEPGPAATVERSRFLPPSHREWPGHWQVPPTGWPVMLNARPIAPGVGPALREILGALPPAQRVVVGLRDVAGCEVGEITEIVGQPAEQVRTLLHHGRAELRRGLERHLAQAQ